MNRIRNWNLYRPILNWRIAEAVKKWTAADENAYKFYADLVKPGSIVFDVGANIGKRTKVFVRLQAQVIAVEPQRQCVQVLEKAFGKRVTIIPKALAEKEGEEVSTAVQK